jgi:hypothetical protein
MGSYEQEGCHQSGGRARIRREVEVLSMKHNADLYMRQVTREQTGGHQNIDQQYRELMEDPDNVGSSVFPD